ncbi:glycosyltransferase family 87 protein [Micromonospora sp. WMMD1082]|uniref:glycosyltransferase family 87 protein n=1 Tax=Micromonospora sp. WMMD1082 TaxID=3016104 RepID=UPI002415FEC8|nr:glycosyltransferase family 87 protein [Micromonospora sp. WMMD1082]MDG4792840.1 glycosyltransferase family 87 protein [Micromonospora sp. WMMD1082]
MPAEPATPPSVDLDGPGDRMARRVLGALALAAALPALYLPGTVHNFFDLKIYMSAMDWWAAGHPLYDYVQPDRVQGELYFTYPPFAALLLLPFSWLKLGATVAIFTGLTLLGVVVTTKWLLDPVIRRHRLPHLFTLVVGMLLVLGVESTRETITFGQINMLLVVLILADLLFAVPRGSRWAGVGIGLAAALKLFPGIFVVYLLAGRRWRAATVAAATAAGATLLAAAVAPADSWRFWTHELWATDRVGRTDYTGNQSLFGLLSRLTAPEEPSRLVWLPLVAAVVGYGLWRAVRASQAGDALTGLTLTGLVAALISPITWTHHIYWFIPAVVIIADAALGADPRTIAGARRRRRLVTLAVATTAIIVYGVVSFYDWGVAPSPTDSPWEFLLRNAYVLLCLALLVVLPVRPKADVPQRRGTKTDTLPETPIHR